MVVSSSSGKGRGLVNFFETRLVLDYFFFCFPRRHAGIIYAKSSRCAYIVELKS